jgi:hypothetical protein
MHRLVMRFLLKNHPRSAYLRATLPLLEPVDIPEDADVAKAESALSKQAILSQATQQS